jgi:hypothetical protein
MCGGSSSSCGGGTETWTLNSKGGWDWSYTKTYTKKFTYRTGNGGIGTGTMTTTVRTEVGHKSARVVFKKGPEPKPAKKDGQCRSCWAMGTNPGYSPGATDDWIDRPKLETWQKVVLGAISVVAAGVILAPAAIAVGEGCLAAAPVCAAEIAEAATGGASGGSAVVGAGVVASGAKAITTGKSLSESQTTLSVAQRLLATIGEEGKTAGVLELDGELIPLVSGKSSLPNYAAHGHVEGQAALIMRD